MGFLSVREIWNGRQGSIDDQAIRRYTRKWRVVTDSALIGPAAILLAPGLPFIGVPYVDQSGAVDGFALCRKISPQQTDDPYIWEVSAEFDSEAQTTPEADNPLDRPPVLKWDNTPYQRAITRDMTERLLANSANCPFDPPVEIDDFRPTLTIQKNLPAFAEEAAIEYMNAVNSDQFKIAQPGQAKIQSITGGPEREENHVKIWPVEVKVEFRREGFRLTKLDCGFFELNDDGEPSVIIDRKTGQPLSDPALLDGNGRRLAAGEDPVYLEPFQVYKEVAFAPLMQSLGVTS